MTELIRSKELVAPCKKIYEAPVMTKVIVELEGAILSASREAKVENWQYEQTTSADDSGWY